MDIFTFIFLLVLVGSIVAAFIQASIVLISIIFIVVIALLIFLGFKFGFKAVLLCIAGILVFSIIFALYEETRYSSSSYSSSIKRPTHENLNENALIYLFKASDTAEWMNKDNDGEIRVFCELQEGDCVIVKPYHLAESKVEFHGSQETSYISTFLTDTVAKCNSDIDFITMNKQEYLQCEKKWFNKWRTTSLSSIQSYLEELRQVDEIEKNVEPKNSESSMNDRISVYIYRVTGNIVWEEYNLNKDDLVIIFEYPQERKVCFHGSLEKEIVGYNISIIQDLRISSPIIITLYEYKELSPRWSENWETLTWDEIKKDVEKVREDNNDSLLDKVINIFFSIERSNEPEYKEYVRREGIAVFIYRVPENMIFNGYTLHKDDFIVAFEYPQEYKVCFHGSLEKEVAWNYLSEDQHIMSPIRITLNEYEELEPKWSENWGTLTFEEIKKDIEKLRESTDDTLLDKIRG